MIRYAPRMHQKHRLLVIVPICLATFAVSCGGDDGGFGSNALSTEEFCDKVSSLDSMTGETPEELAAAMKIFRELASDAPTAELRDAMKALLPIVEQMSTVDENDPEAFSKVMELMMDPAVIAAGSVLEEFSTTECGMSSEDTSISDDTMPDDSGESTGYIFDDMSSSDISDYVEAYGTDYYPNGYIGSTSIQGGDGGSEVMVDFTEADSVDGVALCELVVEAISMSSSDTAVRIVIQQDGADVAVRDIGGECATV